MKIKDFKVDIYGVYALTECGRLFYMRNTDHEKKWIELGHTLPAE